MRAEGCRAPSMRGERETVKVTRAVMNPTEVTQEPVARCVAGAARKTVVNGAFNPPAAPSAQYQRRGTARYSDPAARQEV